MESERLEILGGLLAAAELDALLVLGRSSREPDLACFVGGAHLGESLVVVPREGVPRLAYTTEMERDEAASTGLEMLAPGAEGGSGAGRPEGLTGRCLDALRRSGVEGVRIGLAGVYPAGSLAEAVRGLEAAGLRLTSCNPLMRRLRKRKSATERVDIERAAEATCEAFREAALALAAASVDPDGALVLEGVPLTAGALRRRIHVVLSRSGLEQPEGNIVAAGADGGVPHTQGDDARVLRRGESIVVDLFPRSRLFADCTRTFCVGRPPERLAEAHGLVRRALLDAHAAARPGRLGRDLDRAACELFTSAGWPTRQSDPGTITGYVHGLGHGVGYELHELPGFRAGGPEGRLEVGDVFTLEPGLYDTASGFGVRLEDLLVLEAGGPRSLTPLPYELDPGAWPPAR